ncbi:MAG: PIN domain-containing protein [Magnetococcales bacterium]|nr:PIN domain-containing protein [Magnetococcales bacterium]
MSGIDWLLDTSMVIGLLKDYPHAVALAEEQELTLDRTAISQITRMELLGFPGLTENEETAIQSFLNAGHVILLDAAIEQHAIRLRRAGLLKLPDAIIAATAIARRLRLLTLDRDLSKVMSDLYSGW